MNNLFSKITMILFTLFLSVGVALAQHDTHQHGQGKNPSNANPGQETPARINLSNALKSSNVALRGMEKAVEKRNDPLFFESIKDYLRSLQQIEEYFDFSTPDSAGLAKDVAKSEKLMVRHIASLNRLIPQAPAEFQDDLKSALDVAQKIHDGLTVAGSDAAAGGHHGEGGHHRKGGSSHRCGH